MPERIEKTIRIVTYALTEKEVMAAIRAFTALQAGEVFNDSTCATINADGSASIATEYWVQS